jgi:hypothetical protein
MRDVTDPVAMVRIHWLGANREPEMGSTMGATAVFVLGDDASVVPDWPAAGEHHSILLTFTEVDLAVGVIEAKIDFLDRRSVAELLHEGAILLLMAGPTPIAEAEITAVMRE